LAILSSLLLKPGGAKETLRLIVWRDAKRITARQLGGSQVAEVHLERKDGGKGANERDATGHRLCNLDRSRKKKFRGGLDRANTEKSGKRGP